jgi:hypothetical protein
MTTERLQLSPQLKAILEVGGHFRRPSTTASVLPEAFEYFHALQPLDVKSPKWPCRCLWPSIRGLVAAHDVGFSQSSSTTNGPQSA